MEFWWWWLLRTQDDADGLLIWRCLAWRPLLAGFGGTRGIYSSRPRRQHYMHTVVYNPVISHVTLPTGNVYWCKPNLHSYKGS